MLSEWDARESWEFLDDVDGEKQIDEREEESEGA